MFLVVQGAHLRNVPFQEFGFNLAAFFPGGQTHAQHPNVRKLVKPLRCPVASVVGEMEFDC